MNRKSKILVFEIIGILLAIIIGFWVYLVSSAYEFDETKEKSIDNYFEKSIVDILESNGNDEWFLNVPYKTINQEISYRYEKRLKNQGIEIKGIQTNIKNNELKANVKVGSTYIPINFRIKKFSVDKDRKSVELNIIPDSYTKSELIFPSFIDKIILGELVKGIDMKVLFSEFEISKHIKIQKILNTKQNIMIAIDIDTKILDKYIKIIKDNINQKEEAYYRSNTLETQKVLKWIYNYDNIPIEVKKEIIKDFEDKNNSLKNLLALLPVDKLKNLYEELPILTENVEYLEIVKLRTTLIVSMLEESINEILEYVKDIEVTKNFVFCRNIPFGIDDLRIIDSNYINEIYSLNMKKELLEKIDIVKSGKKIALMYKAEEGLYIMFENNKYIPVTKEEYEEKYKIENLQTGEFTKDKKIYKKINDAITKKYGEKVFYRYLKNDDKEAFAIISKESDYQEYKIVILRDYKVLSDEKNTLEEINNSYPNFNLKLATNIMNEVELKYINWTTRKKLIENLKQENYVKEDEKMVFCSYDGKRYIGVGTSDGGRYVYTLYRGVYLEKLYTYEKANQKFKDIPQMILLQDIPE